MNIRARKALGCLLLLSYLGLYAAGAAAAGAWLIPRAPQWALLIYYALAGVAWVAPLKPLFTWMNRSGA